MKQILVATLTLAFTLTAYAGQGPGMQTPFVSVGRVGETDNVDVRRYTGHVTHSASVNLVARVSGELLRMGFKEGDLVKKDQVLFELDPVRYQAAVASAEAKVAENEARLSYAEITYNRSSSLYEQRATSKDTMDSSEAEKDAFVAALAASKATLITSKDDLDNTVITAPISGKIGVSSYTEGNYLTPSSGVIATIIQVDPLRVHFSISNRDFLAMFGTEQRLKENAIVKLRLADDSTYEHDGKVEFIDNQANTRTDSVQVYASFANPDGKLLPGSTVTVMLSRGVSGRVTSVIPSAVMRDSKNAYVYVLDGENRIERRDVTLGALTDAGQIVRSGVSVGEFVVVDGTHKAKPGMVIEPDYVDGVAEAPDKAAGAKTL